SGRASVIETASVVLAFVCFAFPSSYSPSFEIVHVYVASTHTMNTIASRERNEIIAHGTISKHTAKRAQKSSRQLPNTLAYALQFAGGMKKLTGTDGCEPCTRIMRSSTKADTPAVPPEWFSIICANHDHSNGNESRGCIQ